MSIKADPGEDTLHKSVAFANREDSINYTATERTEVTRALVKVDVAHAIDELVKQGLARGDELGLATGILICGYNVVVGIVIEKFDHLEHRLGPLLKVGIDKHRILSLTATESRIHRGLLAKITREVDELEALVVERYDRYKVVEENEVMYEEYMMDDAEICIAAFGIAARIAKNAINEARKQGIKVGLIRPITLWPFPTAPFKKAAEQVKEIISVELSMGQMIEDVKLASECKVPVTLCSRTGGMIPSPEQVLEAIKKANGGAK